MPPSKYVCSTSTRPLLCKTRLAWMVIPKLGGNNSLFSLRTLGKPLKLPLNPRNLSLPLAQMKCVRSGTRGWNPPGFQLALCGEHWASLATEAQLPKVVRVSDGLPNRTDFRNAMLKASGAPGFDGWQASELKALEKYLTPLADELFHLWAETTTLCGNSHDFPRSLANLWSWRVVGIPKRSPNDSRPISVGSNLLRVWHRCLLHQMPGPPSGR